MTRPFAPKVQTNGGCPLSAPHCCQAKQKKTFRAGPRSVHGSSSEKKRTGVVDSPGTIPSNRPNLFSESSLFRSRCHRAAFGLTVAFIRLHSHGLSRLSGSPASLDSGIPEIDVDQRLHDQSIVAQPGPSPPPGAGNTPSWKCRPPSREISTSRSRFSSGGDLLRFCRHDIRGRANMPAAGWVTESSAGWYAAGVLCPWVVVVCSLLREMAVLLLTVTATS